MATRIKLIRNPRYQPSGTKSYVHLLRKFGFTPTKEGPYFVGSRLEQTGKPYALFAAMKSLVGVGGKAHVRRVLQKKLDGDRVGEVPAEDVQNDSMYLAQIAIGTPPQTVNLDFDTGSADLWVWSTELPSDIQAEGKKEHHIFDPKKSSTFKPSPGSTWKIGYGDGSSASGTVGTDTVELADRMSAQFVQGAGDGLLGLAFGSINTVQPTPVKTLVENMIAQDDIPRSAALFTAKLASWRDAADDESFYTFGFIDEATVKASGQEIHYAPVDSSQGFWMFDSPSATVNGRTLKRAGNRAIADTGTTLALVDDDTCAAIYDAIPGARYDSQLQGYIYPANTAAANLPAVSFAVGGKQFAVRKEDLGFAEARPGYVYGGIQSRGDLGFDILGDTFLKGIYAIFDVGNMRFGAVQRQETTQQ